MKNLCLILILISSASLAQSPYIWDTRVSLNRLSNFATDLQRDNPEARSIQDYEAHFVEALNSSPERVELIMSVLQGVEQISRESYELAKKEQLLGHDLRGSKTSSSSSKLRNLVTLVGDDRLRYWVINQSSFNSIFILALSQIHRLEDSEFRIFADGYIKSLIKTNEELNLLNQSLKTYEKTTSAHISWAAELLFLAFSGPIPSANMQNPEASRILPLQFHRIAHLMFRALSETSAYNNSMVTEIRNIAKNYVDLSLDGTSPEMKTALRLSYKSKESLAELIKIIQLPVACKVLTTKKQL
jgi:hypothetical protein